MGWGGGNGHGEFHHRGRRILAVAPVLRAARRLHVTAFHGSWPNAHKNVAVCDVPLYFRSSLTSLRPPFRLSEQNISLRFLTLGNEWVSLRFLMRQFGRLYFKQVFDTLAPPTARESPHDQNYCRLSQRVRTYRACAGCGTGAALIAIDAAIFGSPAYMGSVSSASAWQKWHSALSLAPRLEITGK